MTVGFTAGFLYLAERRRDQGSGVHALWNMFGRSVMLAAGRGNVNPEIDAIPGLAAFLHQETDSFDPTRIPPEFPVSQDSVEEYHRYLSYTVAGLWRIFGISWRVVEILMAVFLAVTAILAYGLFRLGMSRTLSAIGALLFAVSPPVLVMLPRMRDFSKTPFMLAVILFLGVLITRRLSARRTLVLSGLVGCVIGMGMGFRQDLLIAVPPAFLVILMCSFRMPGFTLKWRAANLGLFLVCFLIRQR